MDPLDPPVPAEVLPGAESSPWRKAWRLLRPAVWIAAIPIALVLLVPVLLVAVITKLFEGPFVRSREEVAEFLEARIAPDGDCPVWDEFLGCPIADPELEAIRRLCLDIESECRVQEPPYLADRDMARIRRIALDLRRGSQVSSLLVS